jgi:hypothetical protein
MNNQPPDISGEIKYDRPLMRWLSRRNYYLKSPLFIAHEDYKLDRAHLVILHKLPVHAIAEVELQPFDSTWENTLKYINDACDLLKRPRPGRSPSTLEAQAIISALGLPPLRCYALYLIAVGSGLGERVVYIGQTNSKTHRFKAGHHALTALHHPKYANVEKNFYLTGFEIEDDDDHIFPIEWIHPPEWRQEVLTSIEGQLIFELQPELNSKYRRSSNPAHDLPIVVHNNVSSLLRNTKFGPEFSERDVQAQQDAKDEAAQAAADTARLDQSFNDPRSEPK